MKNKFLNIIIIILIIAILGVIGYLVYNNYSNNDGEVDNDQKNAYKVEDYITIEKANSLNPNRLNIEKVVFKNLDVSLVNNFVDRQNDLINSANRSYLYWSEYNFEGLSLKDGIVAYTDIWYQINGSILTVYYSMNAEDEMGEYTDIAVVNIDLENKKLVTDEDLLRKGNSSFKKIAEERYNDTLEWLQTCDDTYKNCGIQDKNVNTIHTEQFIKNKDIYIDMIVDGLDEAIDSYIKDGKIMYHYSRFAIDMLYQNVGKGGHFDYITVEVG